MKTERGLALAISAGLCTALAACGGLGESGDGSPGTLTMRLDFTPAGHQAPFFYGVKEGIYKKHGLDVEIEHGRGSAVTAQSVGSGQDDFGHANVGPTINAIAEGFELKIVGTLTNRNSWVLYSDKDEPIQTIEEVRGKEILLAGGTPDVYLTEAVFAENGVDLSDVTLQQVDMASKFSLYSQGRADGLVTSVPYGDPIIQESRPSHRLAFADAGLALVDYGLLASEEMLADHPDTVRKFVAATMEAYEAAQADPQAAAAAVSEEWDDLSPEAIEQQWRLQMEHIDVPETEQLPMGCSTDELWEDSMSLLKERANLDENFEVSDFYTEEFLDCGSS